MWPGVVSGAYKSDQGWRPGAVLTVAYERAAGDVELWEDGVLRHRIAGAFAPGSTVFAMVTLSQPRDAMRVQLPFLKGEDEPPPLQ
jgi:hypothetical protein